MLTCMGGSPTWQQRYAGGVLQPGLRPWGADRTAASMLTVWQRGMGVMKVLLRILIPVQNQAGSVSGFPIVTQPFPYYLVLLPGCRLVVAPRAADPAGPGGRAVLRARPAGAVRRGVAGRGAGGRGGGPEMVPHFQVRARALGCMHPGCVSYRTVEGGPALVRCVQAMGAS